jgi:hypothetical protein
MLMVIAVGFFAAFYDAAFDIFEIGKTDPQKITSGAILTFLLHVLGVMALVAVALAGVVLYRRLVSWLT